MKKTLIALAAAGAVAAGAAVAYTDAERSDLRAEIRAYLLDNPEVIMEAVEVLREREAAAAEAARAGAMGRLDSEINNDGYSLVAGNPDGDITLVEFVDYRCGYCKRAHEVVRDVVAADGNIRYVIKEFPILGPDSLVASKAALAAGMQSSSGDYYGFHDALMTHSGQLNKSIVLSLAGRAGLNVAQLQTDMESDEISGMIQRTYALARELDINGTPAFVVGGELAPGFIPKDQLLRMIADARAEG